MKTTNTIHHYKTLQTEKKKFKSKGRLINKKYKRKENAKNKTRTNEK